MGTVFPAKFNINKEYLVNTSLQNNTHDAFRVKQTKQKLPKNNKTPSLSNKNKALLLIHIFLHSTVKFLRFPIPGTNPLWYKAIRRSSR